MKKHPTVVIKLGTSSIVDEKNHQPLLSILAIIVETAVGLRKDGYRVVIVSSGAIGVALEHMNLSRRPKHVPQVQALAAIGQCRLMGLWDQLFSRLGQTIAQILLTRGDIADRTQYLNAQNTMNELLNMGVIPIVNENDTLAVAEIKFGDNDTLSAITAGMIGADYLFLMTDVDCLYDKNPRANPDARPIEVVENIFELEADVSSAGSALGTGGMSTKIVAARLATAAGVTTVITRSSKPGNITGIVKLIEAERDLKRREAAMASSTGSLTPSVEAATDLSATAEHILPLAPLHTRFLPSLQPVRDRQFWILHGLKAHGTLYVDAGAARALADHAGLLPVGIVDVEGSFSQQECVKIVQVNRTTKRSQPHQRGISASPNSTSTSTDHPSHTFLPQTSEPSIPPHALRTLDYEHSPLASPLVHPHPINGASSPFFDASQTREMGRALVNYSAVEIRLIAGLRSTEISGVLGYADSEYVALRENIAMLDAGLSRPATPSFAAAAAAGGPAVRQADGRGGGLAGYVEG